jgi:hypothetical protein
MYCCAHNNIVLSAGLVRPQNRPGRADLTTWTAALPLYSSVIPESGSCDTLVEEEALPTHVFRMQSPEECLPWPPHITWSSFVLLSSLSAQVNCLVPVLSFASTEWYGWP